MSYILKISEAASLAMHTMVVLARDPSGVFSTREISSALSASKDHLSKVLQRLEKVGLVTSIRGPKGGFTLGKNRDDVTLLYIYEAIEGTLEESKCLLENPICGGDWCILGGLSSANNQIRDYLAQTKLSDLPGVINNINSTEVK